MVILSGTIAQCGTYISMFWSETLQPALVHARHDNEETAEVHAIIHAKSSFLVSINFKGNIQSSRLVSPQQSSLQLNKSTSSTQSLQSRYSISYILFAMTVRPVTQFAVPTIGCNSDVYLTFIIYLLNNGQILTLTGNARVSETVAVHCSCSHLSRRIGGLAAQTVWNAEPCKSAD